MPLISDLNQTTMLLRQILLELLCRPNVELICCLVCIEPIWINGSHIITMFITDQLPEGRLPCETLTQVNIGNGSFKVVETPEQINSLIAESQL